MSKRKRNDNSSIEVSGHDMVIRFDPPAAHSATGHIYKVDVTAAVPEGYRVTHVTGACQDRARLEWAFVLRRGLENVGKTMVQYRWAGTRARGPRLWLHCEPMPAEPAKADQVEA